MKIKYEFANEAVEIEVEEKWATIVLDLDREEYNDNHRETRRHCSLDDVDTFYDYNPDFFSKKQTPSWVTEAEKAPTQSWEQGSF